MRKIHLLWLALVAICAFGAVGTASAVAEEGPAEWLENGLGIVTPQPATTEGELLFWDLLTSVSEPQFLCSGVFLGNVGPGGKDEVTEVQNLSLAKINELDPGESGTGLPCTVEKTCETAEMWPASLPWLSQLDLLTATTFEDLVLLNATGTTPEYFMLCRVFFIDNTELCGLQNEDGFEVLNETNDVASTGLSLLEVICGGEEMGALSVDSALISLNSGATLSVSE
jgi:hypothetical protein